VLLCVYYDSKVWHSVGVEQLTESYSVCGVCVGGCMGVLMDSMFTGVSHPGARVH
jgi:hypothetical protein